MAPPEKATAVAAELFALQGYHATSTRAIAEALGVPKGTFYHHFPNKEDLLLRICQESLERITRAASDAVDGVSDPLGRLQALIHAHTRTMLRDQALHTTMLAELRSLSAENRAQVIQLRDAYAAMIRSAIDDCQSADLLEGDPDPHLAALLLLNMLNWTIFWYRDGGAQTPDQIADAITKSLLAGWLPR
jgi:AcrR family transcriptional regulator